MRARQLVCLFPRAWRERYGDEFLATTGDNDLRLRQVIDITVCAVDAWVSPEVRRASRKDRADVTPGESLMLKKMMTSCGTTETVVTRRDAVFGALALIGGSILLAGAGIIVKRAGLVVMGETLLATAFPGALLFAMPFTYLRGRSWRTQLLLVGLPLLILVLIAVLAQLIKVG